MLIDAKRIQEIVIDSLFRDEEIIDGKPTSEPILSDGIIRNYGFHKERLESHREEIKSILSNLSKKFKAGASFLELSEDRVGDQWGEHQNMEELCVLSNALGLSEFHAPKEEWSSCPGGVPYFIVK